MPSGYLAPSGQGQSACRTPVQAVYLPSTVAALQHLTGEPTLATVGQVHRYHPRAFLAPPWSEIYVTDPERRHGLDAAIAEYQRLLDVYPSLGYEVTILPKVSVQERADFILHTLARQSD